jgi:hypothetical membrane protein
LRETSNLFGLFFGILTVAIILASMLIAASLDPDFVFFRDWLSELGDGPGAFEFNSGLILGGVFGIGFSFLGLRPILEPSLSREVGTIFMCTACISAIFVGIYPITYHDEHTVASLGAFISVGIALLFIAYALGIDHPLGRWLTELTRSVFVLFLILFLLAANPIGETLTMIILGVWLVAFSITAIIGNNQDTNHKPSDAVQEVI